jgi:hypothetical protein
MADRSNDDPPDRPELTKRPEFTHKEIRNSFNAMSSSAKLPLRDLNPAHSCAENHAGLKKLCGNLDSWVFRQELAELMRKFWTFRYFWPLRGGHLSAPTHVTSTAILYRNSMAGEDVEAARFAHDFSRRPVLRLSAEKRSRPGSYPPSRDTLDGHRRPRLYRAGNPTSSIPLVKYPRGCGGSVPARRLRRKLIKSSLQEQFGVLFL